jgi:hypothetical protein
MNHYPITVKEIAPTIKHCFKQNDRFFRRALDFTTPVEKMAETNVRRE